MSEYQRSLGERVTLNRPPAAARFCRLRPAAEKILFRPTTRMNLRRLDDPVTTRGTPYILGPLLLFMWLIPLHPNRYGATGAPAGYWIFVGVCTVLGVVWCVRMRRVEFDGRRFVISSYFEKAEVPADRLVRVRVGWFSRGRYPSVILYFDAPTPFGRKVRLYTEWSARTKEFQHLLAELTSIANKQPLPGTVLTPNDKEAFVKGWTEAEWRKIQQQFAETYELQSGAVRVNEVGSDGCLVLKFPYDIDPETFIYFVNYARYPEDIEPGERDIAVVGFATATKEFPGIPKTLIGQRLAFYVPADDTEYDIVFARTEAGETYEIPFAGFSWKKSDTPRVSPAVQALLSD
jgi:hypothetical protein